MNELQQMLDRYIAEGHDAIVVGYPYLYGAVKSRVCDLAERARVGLDIRTDLLKLADELHATQPITRKRCA